ncbi:Ldh family oxidoreductase (plasmid) [Streptomyces microflavus]|uniref:Ldh family oxidoreductase n=1 Tax=Streptomyces microflavus TaxID=1919 RepID=UPI002E156A7B|nr:Ldh family oxidoreductase [Streptomyces microflavus]WSR96456.1 Ldh family oxidoreductase [Streptomyces microflavus]
MPNPAHPIHHAGPVSADLHCRKVPIADVADLMAQACAAAGVPENAARQVADHFLIGELRGKRSHGLAKFAFESRFFPERQARPEIVRERGVFAVIDAHREIGPLSAEFATAAAIERARRFGVGLVGVINTQRYGVLSTFTEAIAAHGLLGIAANTSRAEAVPFGGATAVLGVNPLSFALPTLGEPLSADMGTTLAPMGVLWEHRRSGSPLPEQCFVDAEGRPTRDPHAASSAVVFGDHRGFALSLLLQALTGSVFGFPMGRDVDSTWSTGYAFVAIDPAFAAPDQDAAAANTRLAEQLRAAAATDGTWRLPGDRGRALEAAARTSGTITVPGPLLARLSARAAGDFTSD